jgi:predicted nucleic acid-binding protein
MPERNVICNTSPLLYLHQVSQLDLLGKLYGAVIVPRAVEKELLAGQDRGLDVPEISAIDWIHIRAPMGGNILPAIVDLGRGEAEVIALGLELEGSLLVLDDQLARKIAKINQLYYTGTVGLLIRAKQRGFLHSVRPVLEQLQKTTMWISEELVQLVLEEANELQNGDL